MTTRIFFVCCLFVSSLAFAAGETAPGGLTLHPLFHKGAVLQRDHPLPVWGTAPPDQPVTVELSGQKQVTRSDSTGHWSVKFAPLQAGKAASIRVRSGDVTVDSGPLEVGEVWVASGQSNMERTVADSKDATAEIAAASHPEISFFKVPHTLATEPRREVDATWVRVSPDMAGELSAVAYYYARDLHDELGVPIGIIQAPWGGSTAEVWMPESDLRANPAFAPIVKRATNYLKSFGEAEAAHETWIKGGKAGPEPKRLSDQRHLHSLGQLFNGMIAPIIPYAIRGVIWYQGESNAGRAAQYQTLFPALIKAWRREWNEGDFPFLFVQLANWTMPHDSAWAELREAQATALDLPNTGMAVAIDLGETQNIHPKNKQEVASRLVLQALASTYGRHPVASGPVLTKVEKSGDRMILHFDSVGSGLVDPDGGMLKGFAIAGENRGFLWASAVIKGDTVEVWNHGVPHPVAVRYAWADNPDGDLYNKEGLPAAPFRTDDWPGISTGQ